MPKIIQNNVNLFIFSLIALFAVMIGASIVSSVKVAFLLAVAPLIIFLSVSYKQFLLFLFILLMPFSNASWLSVNIMGIPGAKPFNLSGVLLLFSIFFYGGNLFPKKNSSEKKIFLYLFLYLIIFTITFFRSLDYLQLLHMLNPEQFHSSPVRHILSFYVKPALYFIPFAFIIKHVKTEKELQATLNVICLAGFVCSAFILFISVSNFSLIIQSRSQVRELFSAFMGLHYNSIGSIYIVCFPLILYQAVSKKKIFNIVNLIMAVLVVLLVQSRSAIIAVFIATYMLFFLLKEKKLITVVSIIALTFILFWTPLFLVNTFSTGIETRSVNAVTLGRVDHLWIPLIKEWTANIKLFLFGKGAFGLMTSPRYLSGFLVQAGHAHNAYINYFLNCGIILLILTMGFIAKYSVVAWKTGKKMGYSVFWAYFVSFISYFIGCITERHILPASDNMFLILIAAVMINYARLNLKNYKIHE